jgi:uncharacterized membrane protein
MAPYHHMMAHFPIALMSLTFLLILLRVFMPNDAIRKLEANVFVYGLAIGIAGGVAALVTGLLIWPAEATVTATMGRNKILMASWTVAVWTVVLALRWRIGEKIWEGTGRYLMLGLGAFGTLLAATTGTLGGHLLGSPSRLSGVLNQFGWNVYQTYFAPNWVVATLVVVGIAGIALGLQAGRKPG